MAKKKKMTKAQAASARREKTTYELNREKIRESNVQIRETQRRIQKEKGANPFFIIIVGSVIVLLIFVAAFAVTTGLGSFKQ